MPNVHEDYELLKSVYKHFRNAGAMRGLFHLFMDTHAASLKLAKALHDVDDFLTHAERAIRNPEPNFAAMLNTTFDAHAAFNSRNERGGDPELTKILAKLDPETDTFGMASISTPIHEHELLRANDHKATKDREVVKNFETARRYFFRETTLALLPVSGTSRDYAGENACRWIADHIVGSGEIISKIPEIIHTIGIIGHHAGNGEVKEGIKIIGISEQHRSPAAGKSVPTF